MLTYLNDTTSEQTRLVSFMAFISQRPTVSTKKIKYTLV